jgi:hypothetical protein
MAIEENIMQTTTSDNNNQSSEKSAAQLPDQGIAAKAHEDTFSNPHQYLSVLKDNFYQLSHNHENLSLVDLKIDSKDQTLDPTVRAAAQISVDHYDDLLKLERQGGDSEHPGLTQNVLDFGLDMVDKKLLSHAAYEAGVSSIGVAVGAAGFFITSGTADLEFASISDPILTTTGAVLMGGAAVGTSIAAVAAIAFTGLETYLAFTSYNRVKDYSNEDQSMINKWLKS